MDTDSYIYIYGLNTAAKAHQMQRPDSPIASSHFPATKAPTRMLTQQDEHLRAPSIV
jgi:hypothetical protein